LEYFNEIYNGIKKFVDNSANWLEVIGFIIVFFTAIKVFVLDKRILVFNKKHLFQARSEEHISKLKNIAGKITTLLVDFENNKRAIREELKKSEEIAKSIKKKLIKSDLETTKVLVKEAKRIEKLPDNISQLPFIKKWFHKISNTGELTENIVEQYYFKLTGLITSLEELKKDNEKTLLP
jgi:cell fate (sporulation/competence/biofilm development) regulator YmcA (YheA/YmcA/DUF963 family)